MRGALGKNDSVLQRLRWGRVALLLLTGLGLALDVGGVVGQSTVIDPAYPASYFEFGMVVALGQRNVEVQTFDENKRRLVQHSFALTRDTRADKVQVGDAVEVIYVQTGTEWTLRRLVLLSAGIPMAGPPLPGSGGAGSSARLPTQGADPVRALPKAVTLAPGSAARSASAEARKVTLAAAPAGVNAPAGEVAVDLGKASKPKVAEVVAVPLGETGKGAETVQPKARDIVLETPSEECNRSAADWPSRPLSMAVLDFRYPTEREEAHDIGTTSGGAGTAVADLVFARLEQLPEFALSRGDRQKLYRADFAGAARVGRQLGVDAVLAGTFVPVEEPATADGFAAPRTWELRAGIVDTCTGQLLMRLYSETCTGGAEPGVTAEGVACKRYTVSAREAVDPRVTAGAFKAPLDALLYPLEHNSTVAGQEGVVGVVTEASERGVTIRLAGGAAAKPGDVLAVHARRLSKNPATYTLQNLQDQEIGRVSVRSVHGSTAVGSYAGEIPPKAGDTAEAVMQ